MGVALAIGAVALVFAAIIGLSAYLYLRSKPDDASVWARVTPFVYFAITGLWAMLFIWDVLSGRPFVFHLVAGAFTAALTVWALARNRREKCSE